MGWFIALDGVRGPLKGAFISASWAARSGEI
jgi:hypothetical protein